MNKKRQGCISYLEEDGRCRERTDATALVQVTVRYHPHVCPWPRECGRTGPSRRYRVARRRHVSAILPCKPVRPSPSLATSHVVEAAPSPHMPPERRWQASGRRQGECQAQEPPMSETAHPTATVLGERRRPQPAATRPARLAEMSFPPPPGGVGGGHAALHDYCHQAGREICVMGGDALKNHSHRAAVPRHWRSGLSDRVDRPRTSSAARRRAVGRPTAPAPPFAFPPACTHRVLHGAVADGNDEDCDSDRDSVVHAGAAWVAPGTRAAASALASETSRRSSISESVDCLAFSGSSA